MRPVAIAFIALLALPAAAQDTREWYSVNSACRPVRDLLPGARTPADVLEKIREEAPRSRYDAQAPYRPDAPGDQMVMIETIGGYFALANDRTLCRVLRQKAISDE